MRRIAVLYIIFCFLFVLLLHLYGSPADIYVAATAAIDAFASVEPLTRVIDWEQVPTVTYY